jgi:hypothetical protein
VTATLKIGVIGTGREEIVRLVDGVPGLEPVPTSDIDAATRLQGGELSYIVGVCQSGGGAALAIPIAILGPDRCTNLSKLGRPVPEGDLPGLVAGGIVSFGVARDHIPAIVPALLNALSGQATPAGSA